MTAKVFHAQLFGTRKSKYERLADSDITITKWSLLHPTTPYYFFIRRSEKYRRKYESYWNVCDVFPVGTSGIVTARDQFVVDMDRSQLNRRISLFCKTDESEETVRVRLRLKENYAWRIHQARRELIAEGRRAAHFARILYRPFDVRHIYYHPSVVWRPREKVMRHMEADNLALATTRSVEIGHYEHVLCTRRMLDHHAVSLKEINYLFPLYLYPNGIMPATLFDHEDGRRPNLSAKFVDELCGRLGLGFIPDGRGDLRKTLGPEDIFHYAYAVLHSPTYRTRYAEFLKVDFPRLPLPGDPERFRALAALGADLTALHLMESPTLDRLITEFPEKGDNAVDRVRFADGDRRVWINRAQYFQGVPEECWEFHVGGYRVCHKWLKDRKGRTLAYEEIEHYQRIVVALHETVRLMREIDEWTPD